MGPDGSERTGSFEDPAARVARERFGLEYLFPYQRLVVQNVLDAAEGASEEDGPPSRQIVLLPTGFGKSLCFQLPALLLPGPSLVVYPLLALMEDQRRRLEGLGIACAVFRGGMGPEERRRLERSVETGAAKLVITNPECLRDDRLVEMLKGAGTSHVAIDEAHCVSEWGETFRPAYLELGAALEILDPPMVSAFTATASPTVFEAVARRLFGEKPYRLVEGDPDRPNIFYEVVRTLCKERSLERLARELARPLIVFCSSREGVQILARLLRSRLVTRDVRFYHAGLEREEKLEVEGWFLRSRDGILVSTCAYGMGVDKKDIRSVIHYEAPRSVEAYLQESGRAGRDGGPSRAVLLFARGDEGRAAAGESGDRLRRFRDLLGYAAGTGGCRRETLLDLLGAPREGRGPCSGCDRCDGAAGSGTAGAASSSPGGTASSAAGPDAASFGDFAEGEEEIRAFFAANPRRFGREAAVALLRGEAAVEEPPRCGRWGAMADWERDDVGRALTQAAALGIAREREKWPWKGRWELRRSKGRSTN